ncbi:hypothetical protein DL767_006105 [Monosporascus sp. MG133]|nr:hypothetical protein DL767_006105 [Monosporascus sp. MG133]
MARKSSTDDDLAYGERWDKDRFLFERDRERERDRIEERDRYISRGPPARTREVSPDRPERRPAAARPSYPWEDDRPGPRERRYGDDDRRARRSPPIELERDLDRRLVIDRERERNYRDSSPPPPRPPRPGMLLRRQSSLDTFDRRPMPRFYDKDEPGPPARRGDYRPDPPAPLPLPRSRALPPPRIYAERDYDEIKISDPDRYGNEEYHAYPERVRERELVRTKRRRSGSRTSRARTHRTSSRRSSSRTSTTSSSSSSSSSSSGGTTVTAKSEYPKKGKTRIPARLVSTRALIDLGYPFIQEGNTIVVQKALGQENIDDVLKLSEDYKKAELEVAAARSSHVVEDRREEVFAIPPQKAAVPVMTTAHPPPPPVGYPVAMAPAPAPAVPVAEYVTRDLSPSRSSRTTRHRRSRSISATTTTTSTSYRDPVVVDAYAWEASSQASTAGPVMLVDDRHRTDRDIKMEIAQLEAERDLLKRERRRHRSRHHRSRSRSTAGGELVRAERLPTGELVLYEEQVERIEEPRRGVRIEKDKKGPPPGLMKAMLATLT